ncbi:hypothetical protein AVEN_143870-1 [Araneus ventricosus]|uniref:Uncharacterized protein n=1 Tax=Araneus ventricosus TaxID=182803 RepID=A0A4Y2J8F5_ARAVE|nr:hypothetical protein AVEN_143870-1 [Araneus ventricosus]
MFRKVSSFLLYLNSFFFTFNSIFYGKIILPILPFCERDLKKTRGHYSFIVFDTSPSTGYSRNNEDSGEKRAEHRKTGSHLILDAERETHRGISFQLLFHSKRSLLLGSKRLGLISPANSVPQNSFDTRTKRERQSMNRILSVQKRTLIRKNDKVRTSIIRQPDSSSLPPSRGTQNRTGNQCPPRLFHTDFRLKFGALFCWSPAVATNEGSQWVAMVTGAPNTNSCP